MIHRLESQPTLLGRFALWVSSGLSGGENSLLNTFVSLLACTLFLCSSPDQKRLISSLEDRRVKNTVVFAHGTHAKLFYDQLESQPESDRFSGTTPTVYSLCIYEIHQCRRSRGRRVAGDDGSEKVWPVTGYLCHGAHAARTSILRAGTAPAPQESPIDVRRAQCVLTLSRASLRPRLGWVIFPKARDFGHPRSRSISPLSSL